MTINERVIALVTKRLVLEPGEATPESTLKSLDCGGIEWIALLWAVEDEFGINIEEHDIEGLGTVGNIIKYVENLLRPN